MLLSKTVKVKWYYKTRQHYEEKGYKFTSWNDEFEVKVEDLTDGSHTLVEVKCDGENCNSTKIKSMTWQHYKKQVHSNEKYYCLKCAMRLYGTKNSKQSKLKKGISLGYWLIKNLSLKKAIKIITRWDEKKSM